ncbi:MAG: histidine kinase [Hyphomicrobium sp.]|jgi:two-component system sensor histidine kinase UhpB
MSIRFRLNALFISLLIVALIASVVAMIVSAGPRIRAENDSIKRLAVEFVETTIGSLQGTSDPGDRLQVLLDGLGSLRHVNIYRASDKAAAAASETPVKGEAPAWLNALAEPSPGVEMPVRVNGKDFGNLVIAPRADHEAAEIWESIETTIVGGGALAVATVLLMSLLIGHLLKPIRMVGDALLVLDSGRYDVTVPERGPPEIADICRKLNRLAGTLEGTISENRRLANRIVCIQDEERKDLARELHDELGPYLFAIRAAVTTLKVELQRGSSDREKLLSTCDTIVERMELIQRTNRRVLHKLRPMGLEEFGLRAKLKSLVALLQEDHLEMTINLDVDDAVPACDETSNLTIYRVVQEGLTNALKHADASVIDIGIETAKAKAVLGAAPDAVPDLIRVTIFDDGKGLPEAVKPSYGIAGMSERVRAMGGDVRLTNRANGGAKLEAWIPIGGQPAASPLAHSI